MNYVISCGMWDASDTCWWIVLSIRV